MTRNLYLQRTPTISAEQFLPNQDKPQIPRGVVIFGVGSPRTFLGVVNIREDRIFIYPGDWLVYNDLGFPSYIIKDSEFNSVYERLT